MSRLWSAAFLLRRLRTQKGIALLLVLLVGGTGFLAAAAPRLYDSVADAGLRDSIASTSSQQRNIALVQDGGQTIAALDPDRLDQAGAAFQAEFDPALVDSIASRDAVVTLPRFAFDGPLYPSFVTLRAQPAAVNAVHLTSGRWPEATGQTVRGPGVDPATVEIAVSERVAEQGGIEPGQSFQARVDSDDPLASEFTVARLLVTGTFQVDDPAADLWFGDNRIFQTELVNTPNFTYAYIAALIAPEALPQVAANQGVRVEWRYYIDPARMTVDRLDTVLPALQRLETSYGRSTIRTSGDVVLRTGLVSVIGRYAIERSAADAVLLVAALGPLVLAAAAIAMLAVLLARQRRPALQIARGRGASAPLLLGTQLWEATLLAGGAALAGYLIATVVVPGRATTVSAVGALVVGVVATLVLTASVVPTLRQSLDVATRDITPPIRLTPRRFVLEATLVGLAAAGVFLLQQRGLTIDPNGRTLVRVDPFLAAVPVLVGAAAGLLLNRLYPIPIRALSWIATGRRGVVAVLGLRHVSRRPSFSAIPVLVLLATGAFGAFAMTTMASLDRGQVEASWREVGADYRIDVGANRILSGFDLATVPGTEAVAHAFVNERATAALSSTRRVPIRLIAIEAEAYTAVAGPPIAATWPDAFLRPDAAVDGTPEHPVPAILSTVLPPATDPIATGQKVKVRVGDNFLSFEIVDIREEIPGLVNDGVFLVVPFGTLHEMEPGPTNPNVAYIRAPESAGPAIEAAVTNNEPLATTLLSRRAWYDDLRSTPLMQVIADGFRLAFVLAIGYAAISIITAFTLTAARRSLDVGYLRTIGLSGAQAAGIIVVEHGIPILLALVPGLATGLAVAYLLESDLGLEGFLGGQTAFHVDVEWSGIGIVAALLGGVVIAAIALSTWLVRRAPIADALRAGEA